MHRDPIVEEVREVRDAYARELGYDINAILRSLQEEEVAAGTEVVSLPPRRLPVASAGLKAD